MATPSNSDKVQTAWRALSIGGSGTGWRTIPVIPSRLLAGRRFPENEEAILVGFQLANPPKKMTESNGFYVEQVELRDSKLWLALARQNTGDLELFTLVVGDVLALLEQNNVGEEELLKLFLGRLKAWQEFMQRGSGILSPDAEIGLHGELLLLKQIIEAGMPATEALEAWQGPLDGIHDFVIGPGAIEVKTSIAPQGFIAHIDSLEQLDDSLKQPLFLACIKLTAGETGHSLPELITQVRAILIAKPIALSLLENSLLHAGFMEKWATRYTRRFALSSVSIMHVAGDFPRLIRATTTPSIIKARYQIELAVKQEILLEQALRQLGGV